MRNTATGTAIARQPLLQPSSLSTLPAEDMSDVIEIYISQAQAYCDEKQWKKAIEACHEALKITPKNAELYKLLGNVVQRQGNATDAMGFYAKALALRPDFPEVYSNLGSIYASKQSWEKAIAYYQKAIDKDPRFAIAHFNLAKVWKKLDQPEKEALCLAAGLELQPEAGKCEDHYRVGQFLEDKGQIEAAITAYRQAISIDDSFVAAYQRLADLLEDQNDWQEAAVCYRKVLALNAANADKATSGPVAQVTGRSQDPTPNPTPNPLPSQKESPTLAAPTLSKRDQIRLHQLLKSSSQKKLLQPAPRSPALTDAASLSPQAPVHVPGVSQPAAAQFSAAIQPKAQPEPNSVVLRSPTSIAQQYRRAQDWPSAIRALKRAIIQQPQSASLYRDLAKAFDRNSQKQLSAEAWYRSFVLDPSWPTLEHCMELGDTLARFGNSTGAINCFRQAIALRSDFQPAYKKLVWLLRDKGDLKAADALLKQYYARRQRLSEAALGESGRKGESGVAQKNNEKNSGSQLAIAPKASERLTKIQQDAAIAHQLGESLRKQGQWKAAIAAYQKAIGLAPDFSWSHHSLGDCYKKLSDWFNAVVAYRRAIELNPDFVWSHYSLAEALEQLEQWAGAAQHYRQALAISPDNEQVPPRLAGVLQQLLKKSPRDVELYQAIAEQLLGQGKTGEAIATYQMALQIQPGHADLAMTLSKLLADRDPQQAHALLDRALSNTAVANVRSPETLSDSFSDTLSGWQQTANLLNQTHLFDPIYYRATNPGLAAESAPSLLRHYIKQGSATGCNPNPLFDEAFYRAQHPEIAQQNLNSLAHYYRVGHRGSSDPHPFFSGAFYRKTHADVAATDINPLEHYLAYGAKEGRAAFSAEQFSHLLTNTTPADADYLRLWQGPKAPVNQPIDQQTIGIYCNTLGNYFITEIADFIAAAIAQAGHTVVRLNETDAPPDHLDGHWVIAPHEFFYLGEGERWMQKQTWLAQAVMVNVEQPQTTWFSKAFHFMRHSKVIFDINVKSVAIMQALKLPAYWLPLGYLADYVPFTASAELPELLAMRSLPAEVSQQLPSLAAPLSDRPIDLHFIGTLNPRREQFFAQSAQWLSQHYSFLHIPPMGVPLIKGQDQALDTAAVVGLSRRSKILLNVHRDDLPYFEWHRIIFHGLWQNTLVVTEPCHDIPGLVAGEHFIECPLDEMPERVSWLLSSEEGQATAQRVRQAGHEALKAKFDGAEVMARALQLAGTLLNDQKEEKS